MTGPDKLTMEWENQRDSSGPGCLILIIIVLGIFLWWYCREPSVPIVNFNNTNLEKRVERIEKYLGITDEKE